MTQSPSQMTGMTSARLTGYEQNRTSVWPDQPKSRERSAPHPSSSYHGRGGQAKGMHSSSDLYDMVHRVRHGVEYRSRDIRRPRSDSLVCVQPSKHLWARPAEIRARVILSVHDI